MIKLTTQQKLNSVKDDYNAIAEDYANEFYGSDTYEKYINIFISKLNGNKILDCGCGNGNDCRYLAKHNFDIVGIDISENMLKIAKDKLPNIDFRNMNMTDLDFPNDTFDGIISNCSLSHIPRELLHKTMQEHTRVLKPNGYFMCILISGNGEEMCIEPKNTNLKVYTNYFTQESAIKLFEKHGLKIDYIENIIDQGNLGGEFVIIAQNKKNFMSLDTLKFFELDGNLYVYDEVSYLTLRLENNEWELSPVTYMQLCSKYQFDIIDYDTALNNYNIPSPATKLKSVIDQLK